jgi:hypothetical protein
MKAGGAELVGRSESFKLSMNASNLFNLLMTRAL